MSDENVDLDIKLSLIIKDVQGGNLDTSFQAISQLSVYHSQSEQVWQLLGFIAAQREDLDEARRGYCRALSLAPFNAQLYFDIAAVYQSTQNFELARGCMQTALALEPTDNEIRQSYARFLTSLGDVEATQKVLAEKIKMDDEERHKYWARISQYNLNREFENLLEYGKDLMAQGVVDPRVNYLMAVAHQNFNGTEQVVFHLKAVVAAMPAFAGANKGLADYLVQAALLKDIMERQLKEVYFNRDQTPSSPNFYEARAAYQTSLKYDDFEAETHTYFGNLLRRLGENAKAMEQYMDARNLDPNNSIVHFNLASLLNQQSEYSAALDEINIALQLEENFAEAHKLQGQILTACGNFEKAGVSYLAALHLPPKFSTEAFF